MEALTSSSSGGFRVWVSVSPTVYGCDGIGGGFGYAYVVLGVA